MHDRIISRNNGEIVYYKIQIWEDKKLEGDPAYPCIDYKIQGEYAECVENEIVQQSMKILNCTPPWMTENEALWCKDITTLDLLNRSSWEIINQENDIFFKYYTFLEEVSLSGQVHDCLVPCITKKYKTGYISTFKVKIFSETNCINSN